MRFLKKSLPFFIGFFFISLSVTSQNLPTMNVTFKNIENEKVKRSFLKVVARYESLHDCRIVLKQKRIKSSTMQAQPIVSFGKLSKRIDRFQVKLAVYVRDSKRIKVANLPEDVLTGWFAHELGHIVDYQPFTGWQMIGYGLKYIISNSFKREAEHRADYIAIRNNFQEEIIASKKYILENDFLGEEYKAKIKKYYLSVKDVELCMDGEIPVTPTISE